MDRDELLAALTDWIEPGVLAEQVIEAMEEQEIPLTLENAHEVYYAFCDEMASNMRSAAAAVADRVA